MKLTKIALGLTAAAAILTVAWADAKKATITEESLGLRQTNIYHEKDTTGDKTMYSTAPAGTSKKIERAYENAPPMIPHDTEGMLPITIQNNACTGCHDPAVAPAMNATPLPASHFTDYRPETKLSSSGQIVKNDKPIENTSDVLTSSKKLTQLSGSRFNCTLCHAPQSQGEMPIANKFEAEFRKNSSSSSSNLSDVINEGVK